MSKSPQRNLRLRKGGYATPTEILGHGWASSSHVFLGRVKAAIDKKLSPDDVKKN